MKSNTLFLLTVILVNSCIMASAQERSQADVSINSVTLSSATTGRLVVTKPDIIPIAPGGSRDSKFAVTNNIKCVISVHNENDDDAYETVLVAVLPVEVSTISIPANAMVHKSSPTSPFAGYITFNLGHMTVGQNINVEFTFTKSKYGNKVGAYAFSGTSDPNPANNYKDASF